MRFGHPSSCKDDGCTLTYREHLLGIGVASAALPSRKRIIAGINTTERRWDRDMDAYKRLRSDGLQPPKIDGCHQLEAKSEVSQQIETGLVNVKPRAFGEFAERFGRQVTEPA